MGLGRRGTSRGSTSETTNIPEHGARRPAIITSTACLRSDLREAGIVPDSNHGLACGTRRDACRAILLHITVAARLRSGTEVGAERRRSPCSQVGMASWYSGTSRNRASPQYLVGTQARPCKSQPSQPGRPSWCVSKIGAVRPRTDHRSTQGSGGPVGHAPQRRGAGPARADWVGGGWRWLSVPAGAVGLVAIAWYRSNS